MIGAGLLVSSATLFAWMGWRCSASICGTGGDRPDLDHLVARVVVGYVVACALIVATMASLGGFGFDAFPGSTFALAPLIACTVGLASMIAVSTKAGVAVASGSASSCPDREAFTVLCTGRRVWIPGLLLMVLLLTSVDFVLSFALAPNEWDAMTYHLFLPTRWIQSGAIAHVPTVFGDNSAAFAPQNGALLFAWSMILLQSDAATNAMQASGLVVIGLGTFYLARCLGVRRPGAVLTGCLPFFVEPLREQVFSADVDGWMASFHVSALATLVLYIRSGRPAALWIAGAATGLAAGTKTIGATLGLLLFVAAVWSAWRHRHLPHLAVFLGVALLTGGFWYVRNFVSFGNPVFPLDFGLGPFRFRGAYTMSDVRAGEFHLDSVGAVAHHLIGSVGWLQALVIAIGTVALARMGLGFKAGTGETRVARLLLGIGVTWGVWFVVGVPHNSQERLALPAVLALLPAAALPFRALVASSATIGVATTIATGIGLLWSVHPIAPWAGQVDALRASQVSLPPIVALSALALTAWAFFLDSMVRGRSRLRRATLLLGALVFTSLFCNAVAEANEDSRLVRFASSDFAGWLEHIENLHERDVAPAVIAYSGANVPYVLVGRRLRHRVVYVNTLGAPDDGFFEQWVRDGRRRYGTYKPGLYRSPDGGSGVWLANLRQRDPQWLYLFTLHPFEREYLRSTADGLPVESEWVRDHAERFEQVFRGVDSEVYRVR